MDGPMSCKLCGLEHRGWVSCLKAKADAEQLVVQGLGLVANECPTSLEMVVHDEPATFTSMELVVHEESRHGKYKDPEVRKAYRRKWMRDHPPKGKA